MTILSIFHVKSTVQLIEIFKRENKQKSVESRRRGTLADRMTASPVMHASRVRTPLVYLLSTLLVDQAIAASSS